MHSQKKTVIITGASFGIGKTAAKHFAARDFNVIATMRYPEAEAEWVEIRDVLVTRINSWTIR